MDPVSAIGLASAVLSFIDFGTKIINGTKQIYDATSGVKQENATVEAIVGDLQKLSAKLSGPDPETRTESDKELCELAAECKRLAEDLKQLLDRIKPKIKGSKRHSFVSALKDEMFSGRKEELRLRLEACRGQLHFKLSYVTSRDTQDKLRDVIDLSTSSNTRLEELQASVEQLRNSIQAPGLDEATKSSLQALLTVPEKDLDAVAQERVLNALKFDEMNHRFNQVSEAHAKTFEWIFCEEDNEEDLFEEGESEEEDFEKTQHEEEFPEEYQRREDSCEDEEPKDEPSKAREREEFCGQEERNEFSEEEEREEDIYEEGNRQELVEAYREWCEEEHEEEHEEERQETRRRFLDWLSFGSGVFHFSAKLGAGKSTLMKLIIDNPHVQDRLQQWAGGSRELILAAHFFWKPGTLYQKSFEGMCRALLFGVLQGRPELTRQLLPRHWKSAWATPWQASQELQIHDSDVRDALELLVERSKVDETCRFCFFVDGLDELEESVDFKHIHLVRALNEFSGKSSGNIKFCVSSREYNVFLNNFRQEQRVRLHDLTKKDMEKYARDELTRGLRDYGTTEPETSFVVKPLVDSIVERAQGIFLWVRLVVNDLCEQLENGTVPVDLHHEIDRLPEDIDNLFAHFLNSINRGQSCKAYRTIAMVVESSRWNVPLSLLDWNFFEIYEKNRPGLAFQCPIPCTGRDVDDLENSKKRLNKCLRGLVELRDTKEEHSTNSHLLQVTHRSVEDFLYQEQKKKSNYHDLCEFEATDALSQVLILAWRHVFETRGLWLNLRYSWSGFMQMRVQCFSETSNWGFFDSLVSYMDEHSIGSEDLATCQKLELFTTSIGRDRDNFVFHHAGYISTKVSHKKVEGFNDESGRIYSPRFVLVQAGYDKYEISKLQTTQGTPKNPKHVSLLANCILAHLMSVWRGTKKRGWVPDPEFGVAIIFTLLDRGLLYPDFEMDTWFDPLDEPELLADWRPTFLEVTFLAASILAGSDLHFSIEGILEHLLRYKANLGFIIEPVVGEDKKYTVKLKRPGMGERCLHLPRYHNKNGRMEHYKATMIRTLEPRQIIELSSFRNKETLLQLIDNQSIPGGEGSGNDADDLESRQDGADGSLGNTQQKDYYSNVGNSSSEVRQIIRAGEEQLSQTAERSNFYSHPVFWAAIGIGLQIWLAM